ncbi:Iron import ATP-binding/permease protein IrtA [Slackia heliotrinireducens]|uniref:ABC-type multidrug transport system, ATPase and permease component n=1 Tax=Slackia heliotrinireducens (strain ATCC 29202 / DSM 20476 / NCTC 11029 / RHS 1) TaxID=471855 RepID=C7N392_SLAHD|nr:ABC transporter ATP-binding protein [Slackia heliotrinireducens]ACV23615.1 ABC-type multidrug transport system, ATPase and permease component [Slackia heliotrinireducens DSM 20476]VEH03097.1 Iron import ATP-binding/permease protein IrtA [Slackia heliotrinireducens]
MADTVKKKSDLGVLLEYAGRRRGLTYLGLALSAISMVLSMAPYICIWLAVRDLIAVAPNWSNASSVSLYGWAAFAFAVAGIIVYFAALMCTHLAAFRTASNIRKRGMAHLMRTPLGYFDNNASGLIRNRLDGASAETETLLAHNLADIVGTVAMLVSVIAIMFVFDWRMGLACLLAAVISIISMFAMMGGKNADLIREYQAAQDRMSKAGTEYVRGIPVVKVFQQTVNSFKAFKEAIDDYSEKASNYQGKVCRIPQAVNLTFTEGAFVFLVPVALFLAPGALASNDFAGFVTDFAFYAVFSAIISTALAKIMFATSGMMLASTALRRIEYVMDAPTLKVSADPAVPQSNRVEFKNVSFTYEGAAEPALKNVSFVAESGQTVALVGPSGGGKTTAASLVPRFWDVTSGSVEVGGVDVRAMDPHVLMDQIAFVFQNNHLFKTSISENVRAARPEAAREEVIAAHSAAQCDDIIAKLPDGIDTKIGTEGTYLSGGEQQRIALARALLKDAPIVVLDEATAFADPENEMLIQKAFAKLAQGRTVIMIAHRLSTVVNADQIVVLDSGKAVEKGTHEELVAAGGLYARMWNDYNKAATWRIAGAAQIPQSDPKRPEPLAGIEVM